MEMITRRGLIGGLAAFIAAPAIIRVAQLMPIKAELVDAVELEYPFVRFTPPHGSFGIYAMTDSGLFYFSEDSANGGWVRVGVEN